MIESRTNLVCECGHTGVYIVRRSNPPYILPGDSHALEGFSGGGEIPISVPQMHCPSCGQSGKVDWVQAP